MRIETGFTPPEVIVTTEVLQRKTIDAYLNVMNNLRPGFSEAGIAEMLGNRLADSGINDFWCNMPIMVLIGTSRFQDMAESSCKLKQPSEGVRLMEGDVVFVDIHPRHESGRWGNFAASSMYLPTDRDIEQIGFLRALQRIHENVISEVHGQMYANGVAEQFKTLFSEERIQPLNGGNFGKSMGEGTENSYKPEFIVTGSAQKMGGKIFGIEPGGLKEGTQRQTLVGRFEDCLHIPRQGKATILGRREPLPVYFR